MRQRGEREKAHVILSLWHTHPLDLLPPWRSCFWGQARKKAKVPDDVVCEGSSTHFSLSYFFQYTDRSSTLEVIKRFLRQNSHTHNTNLQIQPGIFLMYTTKRNLRIRDQQRTCVWAFSSPSQNVILISHFASSFSLKKGTRGHSKDTHANKRKARLKLLWLYVSCVCPHELLFQRKRTKKGKDRMTPSFFRTHERGRVSYIFKISNFITGARGDPKILLYFYLQHFTSLSAIMPFYTS